MKYGILPCGRCGDTAAFKVHIEGNSGYCETCGLEDTEVHGNPAGSIVAWNSISAAAHPEPEDYYELLEECWQQEATSAGGEVMATFKLLSEKTFRLSNRVSPEVVRRREQYRILRELRTEYGEDQ